MSGIKDFLLFLKFNLRQRRLRKYILATVYDWTHKSPDEVAHFDKYVSLGECCLPRGFLTEYGLKPRKADGEKSMPFDLMYFIDARLITTHILINFKKFLNRLEFSSKDGFFIRAFQSGFNHDMDLGDDLSALKQRYYNRIKNFNEIMQSEENIMFVQSLGYTEDVDNLYRVLKYKRRNKPFKLVILDIKYDEPAVKKHRKEVTVIRRPIPSKDYIWHEPLYRESEAGKKFEKELMEKIRECI